MRYVKWDCFGSSIYYSYEKGERKMIVHNEEVQAVNCEPGVTRKILSYSEELMMTEVSFEKGARGNEHKHPHRQITYVAKGEFEFNMDGEVHVVRQGDSILIPGDMLHGVHALEEGILVDIFTPMRKDFL